MAKGKPKPGRDYTAIGDAMFAAIEYYGGQCSCCGEQQTSFLGVVPTPGEAVEDPPCDGFNDSAKFYGRLMKAGYPTRYMVHCANCAWATRRFGTCPHKLSKPKPRPAEIIRREGEVHVDKVRIDSAEMTDGLVGERLHWNYTTTPTRHAIIYCDRLTGKSESMTVLERGVHGIQFGVDNDLPFTLRNVRLNLNPRVPAIMTGGVRIVEKCVITAGLEPDDIFAVCIYWKSTYTGPNPWWTCTEGVSLMEAVRIAEEHQGNVDCERAVVVPLPMSQRSNDGG